MELNIRNDSDRIQNVPIQCKMTLTIREAADIQQHRHQQNRLLAENAELPVRFVHWNAETGQESGI